MAARISKKLYFDVNFGGGTGSLPVAGVSVPATVAALYFPCTPFTNGVVGDRYGGIMQAVLACTGNTPGGQKARAAVSAWFKLGGGAIGASAAAALSVTSAAVCAVDFVQPTLFVANHALVTRLRYLNSAGTVQFQKTGEEAIYGTVGIQRHFSVRVRKPNASGVGSTASIRGTLYVARQHTIEV